MTCARERRLAPRTLLAYLALALITSTAGATDWQSVGSFSDVTVRVDADSVRRADDGGISAWVWFEPVKRSGWSRLAGRADSARMLSEGKERVSVDCRKRLYQVRDFEGRPHNPRYFGRPSEAIPGSEADAVLSWLCME